MNQSNRASIKPSTVHTDTTGGVTTTDSYNSADELTTSVTGSSTTSFGFDAQGNRCAQIVSTTAPGCTSPPSTATTDGFTAYGQLCWSGTGGTASGEGTCTSPPSGASTYSYDGTGLRVSDKINGTSQNFVYDTQTRSGQPLIIMDGQNAYIYGPASFGSGTGPVEQLPVSLPVTPTYLFSDFSGVRSVMTAVGVTTESYSYNAYGTRTGTPAGGLSATSFGFQGGYTDPVAGSTGSANGLVYLIDRYYDPSTDQFISVDPLESETGQPYAYAGDDPVNKEDPSGLYIMGPDGQSCSGYGCGVQATTTEQDDTTDYESTASPPNVNTSVGREQYIFNNLVENGLTWEQTSAVLGNLLQENSALDASGPSGLGGGFGIEQWSPGSSLIGLQNWAELAGVADTNFQEQVYYLYAEITVPSQLKYVANPSVLPEFFMDRYNTDNATQQFELAVEHASEPYMKHRMCYAESVLSSGGSSFDPGCAS
jgi:RHS repeat-associated protein